MLNRLASLGRRVFTVRSIPEVKVHAVSLPRWRGPGFRIAVLSDLHVVAPWSSLRDMARVVRTVNGISPDLIVLAGDYLSEAKIPGRRASASEIAAVLSELRADFGVLAVLGNHDWQDCELARSDGYRTCSIMGAFAGTPIRLLRNEAVDLTIGGQQLWLVGFDSQRPVPTDPRRGLHRPETAFEKVPAGAPAILLAHEPVYFAQGDERAGLQISGHTHGGQLNLFGWRPLVGLNSDPRYTHGLIEEGGRSMVISSGLGFSGVPLRIGQPPEITLIDIAPAGDAT